MIKVFMVEDEAIIREGLRDIIPWQQYGFTLVGDAADGEQALPLIRKQKPDVLITDIKMPFMDGLALSKLVSREFPDTKIVIISGYDDFEYARQAIQIGVEQYLLKPITKTMLIRTLQEIQEKIQSEQEQKEYLDQFRSEMQEYEQFSRRRFFEQMVAGALSVEEICERAQRLDLDIHGQCYNLILYSIRPESRSVRDGMADEELLRAEEDLAQYLEQYQEYLVFRWNLTTHAVLIKGEPQQVVNFTQRCVEMIEQRMSQIPSGLVEWYAAIGNPVDRLSSLPGCFSAVSHIFSYRHLLVGQHILTEKSVQNMMPGNEEKNLKNIDMRSIDPSVLRGFLQNGSPEEITEFASEYVDSMKDAADSRLFTQYLMLNVRFAATAYLGELGYPEEALLDGLSAMSLIGQSVSRRELKYYISEVLQRALELREKESKSQHRSIIGQAVAYIDENYADESISLGEVASYTEVSANYFSAVFSQEMQQTFVEYLTRKRMEKARELLRQSDRRTSEIAAMVGYRDPHYFSFVFRKTQGCTPREYRTGGRRG